MSRLKLYWPDQLRNRNTDRGFRVVGDFEEPTIIPFPNSDRETASQPAFDLLTRARVIHRNQTCRCGSAAVDPIELHDAMLNRNRLPIPGTATLVGFRCNCCRTEWPATE